MIPINVDRNANKKDFEAANSHGHVLLVNSFYTYQGEGPLAGRPAYFWRAAGCNIGAKQDCQFCDTKFDLESAYSTNYETLTETLAQCRQANVVVITGGEPLLQWFAFMEIIKRANRDTRFEHRNLCWQFETNGLLLRYEMVVPSVVENVQYVISPKVTHGREHYTVMPSWWKEFPGAVNLKYVVSAEWDSPYHDVPSDAIEAARTKGVHVYVSGMTVYRRAPHRGEIANIWDETLIDHAQTAKNYRHAARTALKHGLRTTFQTQLFGGVE